MEVRAVSKYIRMSAHKVRLVADLVRGQGVEEALAILRFANKAAAGPVAKTIASAAANAEENHGLARGDLYVARHDDRRGPHAAARSCRGTWTVQAAPEAQRAYYGCSRGA